MVRKRPRVRIEVSDPSFLNGRWHCVGKILGTKSERLPWLGSDPPPDEPEDEPLTATLYLVAGAGASPEEAKRQVMAKIHNVWGSNPHRHQALAFSSPMPPLETTPGKDRRSFPDS